MNKLLELDQRYSTTRRIVKADPVENPEALALITNAVKHSHKPEDKFRTVLFLPGGEGRQGEGGLRTQGYFKIGGLISKNALIASKAMPPIATSLRRASATRQSIDKENVIANEGFSHNEHSKPLHHEGTSPSTHNPEPLITVVTVVYNGEKFLEETILSVINQTYENVEYIIIDGGSTDSTLDIIKKYEHAIDYWVSEQDKGIYDAMNKGINLAAGEWINFMNADDFFASNGVIKEVASYSCSVLNSATIIYGGLTLVNQKGELLRVIDNSEKLVKKLIKTKLAIPHQAQFVKLSIIKKIDKFKPSYRIAADYEMTIRLLREGACYKINDFMIAKMRIGGISSDPINSKLLLLEYRKAQVDNNLRVTSGFIFLWTRFYLRLFVLKLFGDSMTRIILNIANKIFRHDTVLNNAQK
jgi:glycosyltransferase involved in cell wall biosynthesis